MSDLHVHDQADLAMRLVLAHIQAHCRAADTFDGVARWWLGSYWDQISAAALRIALGRLVAAGVLDTRRLPSGAMLWYASAKSDHSGYGNGRDK